MLPSELKAADFNNYPPQARGFVSRFLPVFRVAPLSFLPNLLREVIEYDYKFPAERQSLEGELKCLSDLPDSTLQEWFRPLAAIQLSASLEKFDWVNSPAQFVEQLSNHLWSTRQTDAFRSAATAFADQVHACAPSQQPAMPRLGIAIIGRGVDQYPEPLFRKLRPHGIFCTAVKPEDGLSVLLDHAAERAKKSTEPYAHWYVDGGQPAEHASLLTLVAYSNLERVRSIVSAKIRADIEQPGMGPEALRSNMARWQPSDLGFPEGSDPILSRFQTKLLTEGSGTQIFSTSFAQWAAREALRRAQPLTLVVRFAPRQRERSMNELWLAKSEPSQLDPVGALVDADMGAYYHWINQQRLPGAEASAFIAWFEGHNVAVVVGPSSPRGTVSDSPVTIRELLTWAS